MSLSLFARIAGLMFFSLAQTGSALLPNRSCVIAAAPVALPPATVTINASATDLAGNWLPTRPPLSPSWTVAVAWTLDNPALLKLPVALATDRIDRLYIVDAGADRIVIVNRLSGKIVGAWGSSGSQPGRFRFRRPLYNEDGGDDLAQSAGGIAVDRDGRVAVADFANHRIQLFDRDGRWLAAWGKFGSASGQFDLPAAIAIDHMGRFVVGDLGNHRLQVFDRQGRFVQAWGGLGTGLGQLARPAAIAIDPCNRIVVADLWGSRIQVFDWQGQVQAQWPLDGLDLAHTGRVTGVASDSTGKVIVAGRSPSLQWYGVAGQVVATEAGTRIVDGRPIQPVAVVADSSGAIFAIDDETRRVVKLTVGN